MHLFALLLLSVFGATAAELDVNKLLDSVQRHYNGVRTLQVDFEETFAGPGRPRLTESGRLYLRKPGRMRWEYKLPSGKLFLSDGKQVYYYNPSNNRAEKMKLRETEDMRAPLAFLLGRLDFRKDFTEFRARPENGNLVITALPKSDKLPYKQVEFAVSPQHEIRRLIVTGHDNALLTFRFSNERMNPPLNDAMFRFVLPSGAQWVDTGGSEAEN